MFDTDGKMILDFSYDEEQFAAEIAILQSLSNRKKTMTAHHNHRPDLLITVIHLFVFFDPPQHIFLTHAAIGYAKSQCYDIFIA